MNYTFRELERADLAVINLWRNDADLISSLGNNFRFINGEVDQNWFENYLQNRDKAVRLAIIAAAGCPLIGTVQLTNIHCVDRSAEFSIMIGDRDHWSKGVGTLATRFMLDHGFHDLNLNRIYLTVLSSNIRAIKTYERVGFVREGVLREAVFKDGRFEDLIQMSQLRGDKDVPG